MRERLLRVGRVVALLSGAFAVGGASAEVAVRTHAAVERVRRERDRGAAGELVALRLTSPDGSVVAQPRLIAPTGKPARLVLHPPGRHDEILMSFRVEVARQAGGLLSVHYELYLPDQALETNGNLHLSPGVQTAIHLPHGDLVATWLAVPFPSAQFDEYLETERAARRASEEG
jgi:hypothetical protein